MHSLRHQREISHDGLCSTQRQQSVHESLRSHQKDRANIIGSMKAGVPHNAVLDISLKEKMDTSSESHYSWPNAVPAASAEILLTKILILFRIKFPIKMAKTTRLCINYNIILVAAEREIGITRMF